MKDFRELIGVELGPTRWITIGQDRIDAFATATDDHQWIHVDMARAAEGPFGTTVAHGFLTLALSAPLLLETMPIDGYRLVINYGLNRVRFPAPVLAGAAVRARMTVSSVDAIADGDQATINVTLECEGVAKPVCVAEVVFRLLR